MSEPVGARISAKPPPPARECARARTTRRSFTPPSQPAAFDFVPASPTPLQIPFLFTYGGLACVVDEAAPTVMYCIDQSIAGIGTPWMSFSVTGAPLGRIACRFLVWGSTLYMFGGFNPTQTPVTQSNDLWSLDITGAVRTGAAVWARASPASDATGNVVGYPMPRIGFSWTPYQIGAIMYGGLSRPNNATGNPFDCGAIFAPRRNNGASLDLRTFL